MDSAGVECGWKMLVVALSPSGLALHNPAAKSIPARRTRIPKARPTTTPPPVLRFSVIADYVSFSLRAVSLKNACSRTHVLTIPAPCSSRATATTQPSAPRVPLGASRTPIHPRARRLLCPIGTTVSCRGRLTSMRPRYALPSIGSTHVNALTPLAIRYDGLGQLNRCTAVYLGRLASHIAHSPAESHGGLGQ